MKPRQHSALYNDVMHSERWRMVRAQALRRARWRCERCGTRGSLDAHHWRGYAMLGRETVFDLMMLCRDCHNTAHGWRKRRRVWSTVIRLAALCLLAYWAAQWAGLVR